MHGVWKVLAVRSLCHCSPASASCATLDWSALAWWILSWAAVINSVLLILLAVCWSWMVWLNARSSIHAVHEVAHVWIISIVYYSAVVHGDWGEWNWVLIINAGVISSARLLWCGRGWHACMAVGSGILVHVLVGIGVSAWNVIFFSWLRAYTT